MWHERQICIENETQKFGFLNDFNGIPSRVSSGSACILCNRPKCMQNVLALDNLKNVSDIYSHTHSNIFLNLHKRRNYSIAVSPNAARQTLKKAKYIYMLITLFL